MSELLDPTNDYFFKRLFAEAPDLLVDFINDLRPDLPDITCESHVRWRLPQTGLDSAP